MIVISNTSPLTNLAAIGQFDLLQRLYVKLYIAHGVWEELNLGGKRWPGCDEVAKADWIEQHSVQNQALVTALQRDLDRGEAESIALALQLNADLVLLDEKEGRHAAQRLGLRVVGVVGILLEAKASGMLDRVHPALDALRQSAGFYLSAPLYQYALTLAGENEGS
jgi:predicted nucleic acid-binding protein